MQKVQLAIASKIGRRKAMEKIGIKEQELRIHYKLNKIQ